MTFGFGLVEGFFAVIGILIGNRLERINRRQYRNLKVLSKLVSILGTITLVAFSLDHIFLGSSSSVVAFWIGLLAGFYFTKLRKEVSRSRLELIRGFARAGSKRG